MTEQQLEQAIDGYGLDDSQLADDHGAESFDQCRPPPPPHLHVAHQACTIALTAYIAIASSTAQN